MAEEQRRPEPRAWGITTSKARDARGLGLSGAARALAEELGIPFLPRAGRSLDAVMEAAELEQLLVEERDGLVLYWRDGEALRFHPGMAVPRIRCIKEGRDERLSSVAGLCAGDRVLDCTMGLASDAILMAYAVGDAGCVTAIERSAPIYAVTSYGLRHWQTDSWRLRAAMARVFPRFGDSRDYLRAQPSGSFDVVYFDPMFERPVLHSVNLAPLRRAADYAPLTEETLREARRVARRTVVVKHRAGTLRSLHFDEIAGGRYSPLAYGLLRADSAATRRGAGGRPCGMAPAAGRDCAAAGGGADAETAAGEACGAARAGEEWAECDLW